MGDKMEVIQAIGENAGELSVENVPFIIEDLTDYHFQSEDDFDRGNIEDYIEFVEVWQRHEELIKQIDNYRKTIRQGRPRAARENSQLNPKTTAGKRYIPKNLQCGCGLYETKEEHNIRCMRMRQK